MLASVTSTPIQAQLIISEFLAVNSHSLKDEDGEYSDWIEIHNTNSAPADTGGWYLTDSASNSTKWQFPATNVDAGGYLVIFASGKDRRDPGRPLHTSFKLGSNGEYLALVQPDGITKSTEFAPGYPRQFTDVSYGFGIKSSTTVLVSSNSLVRVSIPTSSEFNPDWKSGGYDDSSWLVSTNGVGYDLNLPDPQEGSYAAQVLNTAPVAYWRFGELTGSTAVNKGSLGTASDGTYQGTVDRAVAGPRSPAFTGFEPDNLAAGFNGTDAYVAAPSPLLDNLGEFTMAGWIRPTASQQSRTGLFGQNDVIEFGFIDASTIQLWTFFGSISVPYPYSQNQWHHVAAVGDGASLKLYFDGVLNSTSTAVTPSFGTSPDNFHIGGGGVFDSAGNWFKGQIDEVAVWHRGLSDGEVAQLLPGGSNAQVSYTTNIVTDLQSAMYGINPTALIRIPFQVTDPSAMNQLTLRIRYDDGFVAYLNGAEVARRNAPDSLDWNSTATTRHPDSQALQYEQIDISASRLLLNAGNNLLAIQGLNINATNGDFLLQCELQATSQDTLSSQPGYFTQSTPGKGNDFASLGLGPILSKVGHAPEIPLPGDDLLVTAQVEQASTNIANVTLNYRVMFGTEVALPMNDVGTNGDAIAGDGIWSARIPSGAAAKGQLLRYFVSTSDVSGNSSRWPLFVNAADSEKYQGTVIADTNIHSLLPVLHLFVADTGAADSFSGTRCSLFYDGEFYDNVIINLHGNVTSGFPKKSYHFGFPRDHHFLYRTNQARVDDVYVLTNWGDKSKTHNTLGYEMTAKSGSVGHFAFPVRMQRNALFHSTYDMVEFGDSDWLTRVGRDPNGALYKVDDNLSSPYANAKRTRKFEDNSDLQVLISNLDESRPLNTRALYAYDNLDLPQCVSYFVALALISSQDHGHKNYYVYRDSVGSGEWAILPWDIDLSWGRNWTDFGGYLTDTLYQNNTLTFYNTSQQGKPSNRLYDLIFTYPDFRRMYLRRLRTVMDTLLMPTGTPANQLPIEARIQELMDLIAPTNITPNDASLDYSKWGYWGANTQMRQEAQRIIATHLSGRRAFLFNDPSATVSGERIPSVQPANTTITIASLDFNPVSHNQNEEYIQLLNTNTVAVDISGWALTNAVHFTFKPGTVIPAGASLYVSPFVTAFRARSNTPHGGQGLFIQGNYKGHLNAWGDTVTLQDQAGQTVANYVYAGNPSEVQRYLRITEIMYNPLPLAGNTNDAQEFEYIELKNISSTVTLDLSGVHFTNGISFSFSGSAFTQLKPGEIVLVVRNTNAFTARYGIGLNVAGVFNGHLANTGERLKLEDAWGETVLDFSYSNSWYPITDGIGYSLEIKDETAAWQTWGSMTAWQPSTTVHGSPGKTPIAQRPSIDTISLGNFGVSIAVKSTGGMNYTLEYSDGISATGWTPILPGVLANGNSISLMDTNVLMGQRYYRVRVN